MADRMSMQVAPGAKNLDPSELLGDVDARDIQVGVEHGPSGTQYNRMAAPWAGAAYVVNGDGSITKIAGRDGALTGEELENQYPNLRDVWVQFARAQQNRDASPGSFEALLTDLQSVASNLSDVGQMAESEGQSLAARKMAARQGSL